LRSHLRLLSFPTRRSSDLPNAAQRFLCPSHSAPGDGMLVAGLHPSCDSTRRHSSRDVAHITLAVITLSVQSQVGSPTGRYGTPQDRKSTRLNSSHVKISYA